MQEQKKEKLKILVIDWLIILGVYLFVRLMFIMFGLHLNNTLLRICLDRKSTRLNSSHIEESRMPSSA